MKRLILSALITQGTCLLGQPLVLENVQNDTLNSLWSRLPKNATSIDATTNCVDALLDYLHPSIQNMTNYHGQFSADCTVFFDQAIEQVKCQVNISDASAITQGAGNIPGITLPRGYIERLSVSNILRTHILADWRFGKSQRRTNYLWLKQPNLCSSTGSNSLTKNDVLTESQNKTPSQTLTLTQKNTLNLFANNSNTLSRLLRNTITVSKSNSETAVNSDTSSRFLKNILTASKSNSASVSSTKTEAYTTTESSSLSKQSSGSQTLSDEPSEPKSLTLVQKISQSISESYTPGCSAPPITGLLAAWNAGTGVYADATNQPNRYTVLNGVVTDTLTNIQWEQTAGTGTMGWSSVSSYCAGRATGGLTDWRAPNIVELGSLVDYSSSTSPYLNTTAFPGASALNFWASTSDAGNSGSSWLLNFSNAQSTYKAASTTNQVRCVRSCYPLPPSSRYTVASGEVTDSVTGLVWQRVSTGSTMTQIAAVTHCNGLILSGFSNGWRLPTIKELATLVDYSVFFGNLMMDSSVFAGEPSGPFWSSTSVAGIPTYAWFVSFLNGSVSTASVTYPYNVRCVR